MPNGFTPIHVGSEYMDPMDVYRDESGAFAYLQLLVPMAKTFSRDGVEVSQSLHMPMPRFRRGAEPEAVYYALYLPFSRAGGILDSRISSLESIDEACITGPHLLGIDGPALLLPELVEEEENQEPETA
jgi:hypothetical protein